MQARGHGFKSRSLHRGFKRLEARGQRQEAGRKELTAESAERKRTEVRGRTEGAHCGDRREEESRRQRSEARGKAEGFEDGEWGSAEVDRQSPGSKEFGTGTLTTE